MAVGNLPVPGLPTNLDNCRVKGPTASAAGDRWDCLDIFSLVYYFSLLSPTLWETAPYRLKYCLKGSLNQKQRTNSFEF